MILLLLFNYGCTVSSIDRLLCLCILCKFMIESIFLVCFVLYILFVESVWSLFVVEFLFCHILVIFYFLFSEYFLLFIITGSLLLWFPLSCWARWLGYYWDLSESSCLFELFFVVFCSSRYFVSLVLLLLFGFHSTVCLLFSLQMIKFFILFVCFF